MKSRCSGDNVNEVVEISGLVPSLYELVLLSLYFMTLYGQKVPVMKMSRKLI